MLESRLSTQLTFAARANVFMQRLYNIHVRLAIYIYINFPFKSFRLEKHQKRNKTITPNLITI